MGLGLGLGMTLVKTIHAWRSGWNVGDTFQSCFSGYSFEHDDWDASRMVGSIPMVVGGVTTLVAVKSGFNRWTPKGVNM